MKRVEALIALVKWQYGMVVANPPVPCPRRSFLGMNAGPPFTPTGHICKNRPCKHTKVHVGTSNGPASRCSQSEQNAIIVNLDNEAPSLQMTLAVIPFYSRP